MKPQRSLDSLPPSGDEYWDHANTQLHENREVVNCDHAYEFIDAGVVECTKCKAGFYLSVGWSLKEGKIITPAGLVV